MKFAILTLFLSFFISSAIFGFNDPRKANLAFDNGDFVQAELLFKDAIKNDPDNFKLHFNLGNALAKQGKVEEALSTYMRSQELAENDEDKALVQYNMGTLLAEGEKWQPAALHFRNSLRLNPSDSDTKHNFEKASLKADEENEKDKNQDQQQEDEEQEPPTEYAKAMKAQADRLVAERKYNSAYKLMTEALMVDKTVANFNDFIERINNVNQIDTN